MKSAERPPRPQSLLGPHADIDRGLDDKLWNIIEDCWSQEPSNRPTAELVSLRLRDVNGYPVTVKPQVVVQPRRTVKQVQDWNTSINKHSTAGRAGWINSRSQPNVVPPSRSTWTSGIPQKLGPLYATKRNISAIVLLGVSQSMNRHLLGLEVRRNPG